MRPTKKAPAVLNGSSTSLVLAAYVIVFAGLAALVFRNRDIGSAAGG